MDNIDQIKKGDPARNGAVANPDKIIKMQVAGAGYRTQQARDAYDIAHDAPTTRACRDNPFIPTWPSPA
jgi:hypothetical protein